MKRIKIMLIAVTVLGVTGGLLAFKAKRSGLFCTRSTVNGVCPSGARCPNGLAANFNATGALVCYTITDDITKCSLNGGIACNLTAKMLPE